MTATEEDRYCMPLMTKHDRLLDSSAEASRFQRKIRGMLRPGFNLLMLYAWGVTIVLALIGFPLTSVHVAEPEIWALGFGAITVVALPLILYLHEKKAFYLRDSLLTVFWAFFFTLFLGFPVTVAARLGMHIPLQDLRFEQWDAWMGFRALEIQSWASSHWLGRIANRSYLWLFPLMQLAILLPILAGRLKSSQRFLVANLVAFAIGLPLFAVLPAVAPWFVLKYTNTPDAALCRDVVLLAIRQPGPYVYRFPAGAIGLPSFHAIWAILCVQAMWCFRMMRVPVLLLAMLIVCSTVTTGNHYVVDVIVGVALACLAMMIAERISRSFPTHQASYPGRRNAYLRRIVGPLLERRETSVNSGLVKH